MQRECGPMPNVMAARPNIGGTLCKSSAIPFLVARRKFWLTPVAQVPCSNAANITERKTWDAKWILHLAKFLQGEEPPKCINSVGLPAQEMAKRHASFGWPPVSDIAEVTKPRRETRWNLLECPKLRNRSQPLVGRTSQYFGGHLEEICLIIFSDCR